MDLVFATNNQHKLLEINTILSDTFKILSLKDINCNDEIPETGDTLEANASQKAWYIYEKYNVNCFADDTGLEVDALHGAPGAHSARYAPGPDTNRVTVLLSHLRSVPWEERTARFRCLIVVTTPDGTFHQAEGVCEGYIALSPAGKGGGTSTDREPGSCGGCSLPDGRGRRERRRLELPPFEPSNAEAWPATGPSGQPCLRRDQRTAQGSHALQVPRGVSPVVRGPLLEKRPDPPDCLSPPGRKRGSEAR